MYNFLKVYPKSARSLWKGFDIVAIITPCWAGSVHVVIAQHFLTEVGTQTDGSCTPNGLNSFYLQ